MQILGLADSTPKPENRAKSLFWPSVNNEVDVDHVSCQGFWLCTIIAGMTLLLGVFQGPLILFFSVFEAGFFFLSGVGIRMRSIFAAVAAFLAYLVGSIFMGSGVLRIIGIALLLANVRATWLSARWRATNTEPPPIPLSETWLDQFSDRMPLVLWPGGRFVFYGLAAVELALVLLAIGGRFFAPNDPSH